MLVLVTYDVSLVDAGGAPFSDQHLPRLLPIDSEKRWRDCRPVNRRATTAPLSGR